MRLRSPRMDCRFSASLFLRFSGPPCSILPFQTAIPQDFIIHPPSAIISLPP
jgi:hypothetical protein